MTTGHQRLADGTLVRIDVEAGRYVGRHYAADLTVVNRVVGTLQQVQGEVGQWR